MIPTQNIVAWSNVVPWVEPRQVEQDLIISRVLVEIFGDHTLSETLRFRGGTALHKLHFPHPLRYSEDIDLVRTTKGPIGPIVDRLRELLEPWLGRAQFVQSPAAPKLRFQVESDETSAVPIRLKIEISTREIQAFDGPVTKQFKVVNPWINGEVEIPTFSSEEMLATKLRALLQRDKGRDLFDLAYGLTNLESLTPDRIIEIFCDYMSLDGLSISRAHAEQRMFTKYARPRLWKDVMPLIPVDLAAEQTPTVQDLYFQCVFTDLIQRLPGKPWQRTQETKERLGIVW